MARFLKIRPTALLGLAAVSALAGAILATPLALAAGKYPTKPITIVVPVKPGGGADKYSRSFAKFLGKELGSPVKVVNKPGAGSMLGTKYYMKRPDDGYSLLFQMMPHIGNTILVRGANYKIDDFIFINHPAQDYSAMFTARKKPAAQSIEELIAKIKKNKGKVSIAVQKASSGYINLILMLKALKLTENDVKLITYNSGGPLRNAIAGAHVDVGLIAGYNSIHMKDLFKPLMVFRKDRSPHWDAPAYPEFLKKRGLTSDMVPGTIRGLAIRRSVRDKYPERYKKLVKAMEKTVKDPKVIAHMKKTKMPYEWLGPEESTRRIRASYEKYKKYVHLFKKKKKK